MRGAQSCKFVHQNSNMSDVVPQWDGTYTHGLIVASKYGFKYAIAFHFSHKSPRGTRWPTMLVLPQLQPTEKYTYTEYKHTAKRNELKLTKLI